MNAIQNTQPNTRNFLDLPSEIRHRIYNAAGLVVGANLRLTRKRETFEWFEYQPSAESFHFTYSLLQTCKAINSEVTTLICSQNTLVVAYEHVHYGLDFLRRLNPQQCSALTDLVVQLYLKAPVLGNEFSSLKQLQRSLPPLDSALVASWQAAARHILLHTRPRTLNLRLFCDIVASDTVASDTEDSDTEDSDTEDSDTEDSDTEDSDTEASDTEASDTTFAVLQPLRDSIGVLKDCEIQLHHKRDNARACEIAWEASARAKGFDPNLRTGPFRFFYLPAEIRRRILEYSDLVTPLKEVCWDANHGFCIKISQAGCGGDDCDASLYRGCRFLFCEPLDGPETGYICRRYRSGYSSRCQCWVAPRALFLVNRSFYGEAMQVLYSCNRVVFVPSDGFRSCFGTDNIPTRLDASKFITRHMWPGVLNNLRTIEFLLPAANPASDVSGEPYYSDFCFAIDHLKAHADIPKLTVVLYFASAGSVMHGDLDCIRRELAKSGGDEAVALRTYAQLCSCLKTLRCMRRFFVHLEWGWHWYFEHSRIDFHSQYEDLNKKVNKMESWLEKLVMGDDYNSESAGKITDQPSIWLYWIGGILEHVQWPFPREHMLA
ncbi:hypothetical protein F4818DRAFT_57464 [Hypoxylon cercidicola]|nr:hypothetical protein F4818DRAFT_57464 [Hypoxylon cercidicola]